MLLYIFAISLFVFAIFLLLLVYFSLYCFSHFAAIFYDFMQNHTLVVMLWNVS